MKRKILVLSVITVLLISITFLLKNYNKQTFAYIPNVKDGTISVIDVLKKEQVDLIKVGESVSHGIATTPDGNKIYTGDLDNGDVFVYDIESKKLIKTINTGKRIHGIDITPNGKYVLLASGDLEIHKDFDYIQIIDTDKDEVIKIIESDDKSPAHIDFSKDSRLAFISNVMSNTVSILDIEKGKIIKSIGVGVMPNESELSPDGQFLYVANVQDGSISVIDLEKKKEIDRIKVSPGTHGVAVSKNGKYVWTTNRFSNSVTVIDIKNKNIAKTISTGGEPNHISFVPDGRYAYVSNLQSNDATIIDVNTYEVVGNIELGNEPHEIDFVKIKAKRN